MAMPGRNGQGKLEGKVAIINMSSTAGLSGVRGISS